tara:strand:+ start:349 stop:525 length:177 start_codon:yes stop_codon:yes gene_type:complete
MIISNEKTRIDLLSSLIGRLITFKYQWPKIIEKKTDPVIKEPKKVIKKRKRESGFGEI